MKSNVELISNIEDKKRIYKLDTSVEAIKLNDIKGQEVDVKEFIIKKYTTMPKYDDEGKLIEDGFLNKITLLVDQDEKVYATASKFFANQLEDYIQYFGIESIKEEGFNIRIIEKDLPKTKNKALGFELIG